MKTIQELEWTYSRNQRRHTGYTSRGEEAFWIESCAPYRAFQEKHGYRLRYADGGHIQHSQSVKILKGIASITEPVNPL